MGYRRTSAINVAELGAFWRPSFTSFALLSVGYLPVALLGVLAVQLEAALVMTPVDIGLAIAAYWGTNAVAAPIVGHRADQHGWAPTGALGVAMSGCVLFLLAAVVGSKPTLMLAMAIAGVGLALCSQSSNLTIAREVPWSRQGRAFGLKQTTPPHRAIVLIAAGVGSASVSIATLGAFSVPTLVSSGVGASAITLTLGWGWLPALYPVVMRYWREATARTTGFVSIGTSAGASVGPVVFGVIVASRGYSAA